MANQNKVVFHAEQEYEVYFETTCQMSGQKMSLKKNKLSDGSSTPQKSPSLITERLLC